ncbi:MAG: spondin domain-containing protein [Alphaproteobacteria bacterium]
MKRSTAPTPKVLLTASAAFILSAASASAAFAQCVGEASYQVTFMPNWVEGVTNYDVPSNAHWSPMVVATHANPGEIFSIGERSTAGVQTVAETGGRGPITAELDALFATGTVRAYRTGSLINDAVGTDTVTLSAASAQPYLTMISMIAPSPDWFVGVDGISLCRGSAWVDNLQLPLMAQDAGTDSGVAFASPNQESRPKAAIQYLNPDLNLTSASDEAAVFGTLSIKRN